jgi:hypothetical protein
MHLDEEGINGSESATAIRKEVDLRLGDMKEPGLTVMRIGRQDGRTHEIERPFRRAAPVIPRLVGGSLTCAEYALIGGAPHCTASEEDKRPTASKRERLAPAKRRARWRSRCRRKLGLGLIW